MIRWHLNFKNSQLSGKIEVRVEEILFYWSEHQDAAAQAEVDLGWWMRTRTLVSDKPELAVALSQWNPDREEFDRYAKRVRANLERFLQEQRGAGESELERFARKPYRKRVVSRPAHWDFEWFALHVCKRFSDAQISLRPEYRGVTRDAVKKARQTLEYRLKTRDSVAVGN
jgi:hypothetical protein